MYRAVAALALAGCTSGPELETVVDSEHFRVRAEAGTSLCPEVTGWLEHYAQTLESLFAVSAPVIDYRLYKDAASLGAAGCASLGCAGAGAVDTIFPVHAHELVHVFAERRGQPPHVFAEGLAGVFGCQPSESPAPEAIDVSLVDEILTSEGFDAATARGEPTYPIAASLVRHLLDRFGDEAFLDFYAAAAHDLSRGEIAAVFAERLGAELDAELARWSASPPPRICRRDVECSMFSLPAGTLSEVELMCGRLGAPAELPLTIEVDEPGVYIVEVAGDGLRGASVGSCEGGAPRSIESGPVELEAGRHHLLVRGQRAGDAASIRWRPAP